MLNNFIKPIIQYFGERNWVFPLVWLAERNIRHIHPDFSSGEPTLNILALSAFRFEGDLKLLAEKGNIVSYCLPKWIQDAVLALYKPAVNKVQRERFMQNFLRQYCSRNNIKMVLGASYWYQRDIAWGEAADTVGIPYVVLHKECYKTQSSQLQACVRRADQAGSFPGSHLIVHNEHMRQLLVDCGFVAANKISSLGCMRMDKLAEQVKATPATEKKQVVFFSFSPGIGLDEYNCGPWPNNPYIGWVRLFEQSHVAFARAAQQLPEVEFIIKPKWMGRWLKHIEQALEASWLSLSDIPNLKVDASISAHECITSSAVVCAFQSTTSLEAAVLGKPVVVPHFAEAVSEQYAEKVKLAKDYDIYTVANSPTEFTQNILQHLEQEYQPSPEVMQKRRKLFEEWISPLDGESTVRYINLLQEIAAAH